MAPALDRQALLADQSLAGVELCRTYSSRMDAWLSEVFAESVEGGAGAGISLVAVGGYGRQELSPQSDIDLLLLHDAKVDVAEVAQRLWYPIWDEGLKLGHAVRTVKDALALAADDLDTATSLLSSRHLAGDAGLTAELADKSAALWRKRSKRWLAELSRTVRVRHDRAGEVAFLLEPDLKDGRGGLRDVHAIHWAEQADTVMLEGDDEALAEAYQVLLAARVELHRRTGRAGDRLLLQEQDAVADALGYGSANELSQSVSAAARTIAWRSDEVWLRVDSSMRGPVSGLMARDKAAAPGVVLREGVVRLTPEADPEEDPLLLLRVAVAAARADARIDRTSLERLSTVTPPMPFPWSDEARALFADLFLAGPAAIAVIEALDQRDLWVRLLPEWEPVRFKPQRNAYHTFTVDRHLCVTATNAAALADRVDRPDLLVVGALLHDIGKGYPGDHTEVGIEVVGRIGERMGFSGDDAAVLADMVRHHLLLPDVATRRDLEDDATLTMVATAVGSRRNLHLLAALTEADSLATGPAAWNSWKAGLVRELVTRVDHLLGGGDMAEVMGEDFPTAAQLSLMAERELIILAEGNQLTVVAPDRPGVFSRVAGALALNGLDVLGADVYSHQGMALEVLTVTSPHDPVIQWDRVTKQLEQALRGRLALSARLADRARSYRRVTPELPGLGASAVKVDNESSAGATVIEVLAPDGVGVLFRLTKAIAELDLDIQSAKVQTLGAQAVDAFYLVDADGKKIDDPAFLAELERAILHAITSG